MPRPFFARLKKYYSDVGKVLRGEAGAASIFSNTSDIGMTREQIYAKLLKSHLPSNCNVALGGFLFDQNGNESSQIDILVTNDATIQFNFLNEDGSGKSFACVDGCIGVVAVKSNLTTAELENALRNISSIPDKQPLTSERVVPGVQIPNHDEWPFKVIYSSDGFTLKNAMEVLQQFYVKNPDIPRHKEPNIIHVAGKYVISRILEDGGELNDGTPIRPHTFVGMTGDSDVLGLRDVIYNMQLIALSSRYVIFTYADLANNIPLL